MKLVLLTETAQLFFLWSSKYDYKTPDKVLAAILFDATFNCNSITLPRNLHYKTFKCAVKEITFQGHEIRLVPLQCHFQICLVSFQAKLWLLGRRHQRSKIPSPCISVKSLSLQKCSRCHLKKKTIVWKQNSTVILTDFRFTLRFNRKNLIKELTSLQIY